MAYISRLGPPNHILPTGSASAQSLAVPKRDASTDQLLEFVRRLPLPEFQKNDLTENERLLCHFVTHFRIRSVDPANAKACCSFANAYFEYRNKNVSYFVNSAQWGRLPLMGALAERHDDMVRELVDRGAKVDCDTISFAVGQGAPDPLVQSLFAVAAKHARYDSDFARLFDTLCVLAERNQPLAVACLKQEHLAGAGRLTIHGAVYCENAAVIQLFKHAGFDLNAAPNGYTPLEVAFHNDRKLVAMALIRSGATVTPEIVDWLGARSTDAEN